MIVYVRNNPKRVIVGVLLVVFLLVLLVMQITANATSRRVAERLEGLGPTPTPIDVVAVAKTVVAAQPTITAAPTSTPFNPQEMAQQVVKLLPTQTPAPTHTATPTARATATATRTPRATVTHTATAMPTQAPTAIMPVATRRVAPVATAAPLVVATAIPVVPNASQFLQAACAMVGAPLPYGTVLEAGSASVVEHIDHANKTIQIYGPVAEHNFASRVEGDHTYTAWQYGNIAESQQALHARVCEQQMHVMEAQGNTYTYRIFLNGEEVPIG